MIWNQITKVSGISHKGVFCFVNGTAPKDGDWLPKGANHMIQGWNFQSTPLTSGKEKGARC